MWHKIFRWQSLFDLLKNNIDCNVLCDKIIINENRRDLRHTRFLTEHFISRNNYTFNDTTNRSIRNFNKFSNFYDDSISRSTFKSRVIRELQSRMRSS